MITFPITFFTSGATAGPPPPPVSTYQLLLNMSSGYQINTRYANVNNRFIAVLDSNGRPTSAFSSNSLGPNATPSSIAKDSSDNYYFLLGGTRWNNIANTRRLVKTNADFVEDATFTTNIGTGFAGTSVGKIVYDPVSNKIAICLSNAISFNGYNGGLTYRFWLLNPDGTLDTAFMANLGTNFNNIVIDVQPDGIGGWIAAGSFTQVNGINSNKLARLNPDGTVDATFAANTGTGSSATMVVNCLIIAGGYIYVGNNMSSYNGHATSCLARLFANGNVDTSFVASVFTGAIRGMAKDSANNIVCVGDGPRICRIDGSGTGATNLTFDHLPSAGCYSVGIDDSDNIYTTGLWTSIAGQGFGKNQYLGKWNVSGANATFDTSWGKFNKLGFVNTSNLPTFNVKRGSDGWLMIWRSNLFSQGNSVSNVQLFTVAEGQTATFSTDWINNFGQGIGTASAITRTTYDDQNRVYLAYLSAGASGPAPANGVTAIDSDLKFNSILRLGLTGVIDTGFNLQAKYNSSVWDVMVDIDDNVVVGGQFTNGTLTTGVFAGLSKLDSTGAVVPGFECTGPTGASSAVYMIKEGSDGYYYVGGTWTTLWAGLPNRRNFIRINKTTGAPETVAWSQVDFPNGAVEAVCMDEINNRILIGGAFTGINLGVTGGTLFAGRIAAIDKSTGQLVSSGWTSGTGFTGANNLVTSILKDNDGKFMVVGAFNSYNGQTANSIIRLNADGTYDPTFDCVLNGVTGSTVNPLGSAGGIEVRDIAQDPNGNYIVQIRQGEYLSGGTRSGQQGLVCLNPNGTIRNEFGWGALQSSYNMTLIEDRDFRRFVTVSGITGAYVNAVRDLVTDLKSSGLWDKCVAIYPFAGDTAYQQKWNLKFPIDSNDYLRLTFNGGWTHSASGALANGTNAYANTNLGTLSCSLTNFHMSFFQRLNFTPASAAIDMGAYDETLNNGTFIASQIAIGTARARAWQTAMDYSTTDERGNWLVTTSGTTATFYNNSTAVASTAASGSLPVANPTIIMGALNRVSGGPGYYSPGEYTFGTMGQDLSSAEVTQLNTIINTYLTAISRNI